MSLKEIVRNRQMVRQKRDRESKLKANQIIKERISKQLFTLGVGNIEKVEIAFGFLWGHGKPERLLTPNEQAWRKVWAELRNALFDNINDRIKITSHILGKVNHHD